MEETQERESQHKLFVLTSQIKRDTLHNNYVSYNVGLKNSSVHVCVCEEENLGQTVVCVCVSMCVCALNKVKVTEKV